MGEKQSQPFQLSFNTSLKIDFQGSRVTSDGGLILVRELDERLGFGELIAQHLTDSNSSSTLCEAKWPELVDSTQGGTFQREILVSRVIAKS